MKVIDAFWEKRNLQTETVEIKLDHEDTISQLRAVVESSSAEYMVLKIPSGAVSLLVGAQDLGFRMVETSIEMAAPLKQMKLPEIYRRFEPKIEIKPADEAFIQQTLSAIKSGEIFQTDRIAMDPHFSKEIAGLRYANWISDLYKSGSELTAAYYNNKPIAFAIGQIKENGSYDASLGGVFPEMAQKGLGFAALYANVKHAEEIGAKRYITHVSSNNLPIIRLHTQFGCDIVGMEYILIMHRSR